MNEVAIVGVPILMYSSTLEHAWRTTDFLAACTRRQRAHRIAMLIDFVKAPEAPDLRQCMVHRLALEGWSRRYAGISLAP